MVFKLLDLFSNKEPNCWLFGGQSWPGRVLSGDPNLVRTGYRGLGYLKCLLLMTSVNKNIGCPGRQDGSARSEDLSPIPGTLMRKAKSTVPKAVV